MAHTEDYLADAGIPLDGPADAVDFVPAAASMNFGSEEADEESEIVGGEDHNEHHPNGIDMKHTEAEAGDNKNNTTLFGGTTDGGAGAGEGLDDNTSDIGSTTGGTGHYSTDQQPAGGEEDDGSTPPNAASAAGAIGTAAGVSMPVDMPPPSASPPLGEALAGEAEASSVPATPITVEAERDPHQIGDNESAAGESIHTPAANEDPGGNDDDSKNVGVGHDAGSNGNHGSNDNADTKDDAGDEDSAAPGAGKSLAHAHSMSFSQQPGADAKEADGPGNGDDIDGGKSGISRTATPGVDEENSQAPAASQQRSHNSAPAPAAPKQQQQASQGAKSGCCIIS
jgi:hypothetical protein